MSLGSEFEINPEKEAAIVDYFRDADRQILTNPDPFMLKTIQYMDQFGRINFAALEQIFRKHHFNAHQLAVRSARIEQDYPGHVVADVNAFYFDNNIIRVPHAVLLCRSFNDVQTKASKYGIDYNDTRNLRNLKSAGDLVKLPTQQQGIIAPPYFPN